jgi:hypothetical protein
LSTRERAQMTQPPHPAPRRPREETHLQERGADKPSAGVRLLLPVTGQRGRLLPSRVGCTWPLVKILILVACPKFIVHAKSEDIGCALFDGGALCFYALGGWHKFLRALTLVASLAHPAIHGSAANSGAQASRDHCQTRGQKTKGLFPVAAYSVRNADMNCENVFSSLTAPGAPAPGGGGTPSGSGIPGAQPPGPGPPGAPGGKPGACGYPPPAIPTPGAKPPGAIPNPPGPIGIPPKPPIPGAPGNAPGIPKPGPPKAIGGMPSPGAPGIPYGGAGAKPCACSCNSCCNCWSLSDPSACVAEPPATWMLLPGGMNEMASTSNFDRVSCRRREREQTRRLTRDARSSTPSNGDRRWRVHLCSPR